MVGLCIDVVWIAYVFQPVQIKIQVEDSLYRIYLQNNMIFSTTGFHYQKMCYLSPAQNTKILIECKLSYP